MRTTIHTTTTTSTTTTLAPEAAAIGVEGGQSYSTWHSPVPYLFGGLAAMLGLIAFALLILACSYWRLSTDGTHHHDRDNDNDDDEGRDLEGGYHGFSKTTMKVLEEKMVVIMAGDDKPTFLATPATLIFSNPHHHDSNSVIHDPNIPCKCTTTSVDDDDKPKQHQITPTYI